MPKRSEINDYDFRIGANIRSRRREIGRTLVFVSLQLGITYQAQAKREKAITRIPSGDLFKYAEILNCKPEDFLK